jgi:hypothetical protein
MWYITFNGNHTVQLSLLGKEEREKGDRGFYCKYIDMPLAT